MNETETAIAQLWTPEGFREDEWSHAGTAEALGGNHRVILPLSIFLQLEETTLKAAIGRVGVHVLPGEAIEALVPFLSQLALVSLAFPVFTDGRSYSKAELLRTRYGYGGILRAAGDVLIDQIALMLRTGIDEFEVTNETALRRLDEGRPGGIAFHYQPTARNAAPGARFSWRRRSAA